VLIALSFPLIGHSSQDPARWQLMPLLGLHLLVVQYWFGSLLPLMHIIGHAPARLSTRVVQEFSSGATWLVPLVFVAGLAIAARLLPDLAALRSPYGIGLLLKVLLFSLLMLLAALNKWRLGPALLLGGRQAQVRLQRCIGAEFVLILLALMGTATLTLFWSPET
jgi:putative copper resistance protein D